MTWSEEPFKTPALPSGTHYYLVGEPNRTQRDMGLHITEFGPFDTRADALDAVPFYDLLLREHLTNWELEGIAFRLLEIEVGDGLAPNPGSIVMVVRTNYLEVPVAGGFTDMDEARWVYGLVIDHVDRRLAYLEEDLFSTLHIDIDEDYVFEPGQTVWIRITSSECLQPSEGELSRPARRHRLGRLDARPGYALSLWQLWQLVPAAHDLDEDDDSLGDEFWSSCARQIAVEAAMPDRVLDLKHPLGPVDP